MGDKVYGFCGTNKCKREVIAKTDIKSYICNTEHYDRLKMNGLENSVEYCLTADTAPVLPFYDKSKRKFIIE